MCIFESDTVKSNCPMQENYEIFKGLIQTVGLFTVNVLKLRTLKIIIFPAVRNFRNYVSEKVLVFVILECGL